MNKFLMPAAALLALLMRTAQAGTACTATAASATAAVVATMPLAVGRYGSVAKVVHMALSKLAEEALPSYEPDDGPLTARQLAAVRKLAKASRQNKVSNIGWM